MIGDGAGLRDGGRLRGAPGGGRGRHDQPVVRRRQRLPAHRAGAAARHRADRTAHPRVRPLQPGGRRSPAPSARWPRGCPGWVAERTDALRARRPAGRVLLLRAGRGGAAPRLPAAGAPSAGRRGRAGPERPRSVPGRSCCASRPCSASTPSAGGFAVQSILVLWLSLRFGLSTAPVGRGVLLERPAHGQLGPAGAADRRPHRPDPHDGVHAHPRQPAAHLRRPHADGRARGGLPARPLAPVADGCARPHELRDGGGRPRGAHGGGQPSPTSPAAWPRPSRRSRPGGCSQHSDLRLAPDHRRACSRSPTTSPCSPCSTTSARPRSVPRMTGQA